MSSSNGAHRELSVGIVGAGFGGVGMGIRLQQEALASFEIFERGNSVGGVWRANTYPGAACDVPSHLYSFSFAPGHRWSRRYAPQAEILAYLRECSTDYGIDPHLHLGAEVTGASFDPAAGRWTVRTEDGGAGEFDLLVTACGQLTRPSIPPLAGIEEFDGPAFHSAEWDHEIDLTGKRVAVIGTGASAIQFVPEVAEIAASTTIYQRSAPWIVPKLDRLYPAWEQAVFRRFPARVAASRRRLLRLLRDGDVRLHRQPLGVGTGQANRQLGAPPDARPRPRAAREDDPGLRAWMQAGPVHERLVPDPASRRRRALQRGRRAGHLRGAWSAPTGSSARRT